MIQCKDCKTEGITTTRAVFQVRGKDAPGKRCKTHYYQFKNRTKANARGTYVDRTYGMSPEQNAELETFQGGKCAICQRATGKTRALSIDHDHSCCKETPTCGTCNRGLLCRPCNDMLGHGRDDPEFFERAAFYLKDPPAKALRFLNMLLASGDLVHQIYRDQAEHTRTRGYSYYRFMDLAKDDE